MTETHWRNFEPATFDAARERELPILLVITQTWCQHSKNLLSKTLQAPEVLRALHGQFLAIHVDAERRPDVNDRYGSGSWPTLAYLTPNGELISNDGFLSADELVSRLAKIRQFLATNSDKLEAGLKSLWSQKNSDSTPAHHGKLNQEIVDDVVASIYDKFDHRYGGWGESSKFPHPEAIDFALVQVSKKSDNQMREVVTLTLDKMMEGAIHDTIDGAFFRFSKTPDWRSPNFEKMLDSNAARLRCYLEAYQLFDEPAYRKAAEGIISWMLEFMLDEETGAFFGNQDADSDYYLLDKEGRAAHKRPGLDQTIYTNWNALAVSSLLKSAVVLERPELRDQAMRTLNFLLEHLYDEHDGVYHYWDGTYHLPGMLSDQAHLIRACIDASQHSGNADLLLPAEAIADMAIEQQKAPGGGFYDILNDQRQRGSMRRRNRSILENSLMAEALLRLSILSKRHEYHDEAVQTLEAFTQDFKEYGYYVAGYGRAVDLIFYQPLTITIVGDRDSDAAQLMRSAALSTYVPSRIVQMLDPKYDPILLERSQFEIKEQPVAYLGLGLDQKSKAHSPTELLQKMKDLEQHRG